MCALVVVKYIAMSLAVSGTVGPRLSMCHSNVKGVQISEFVWISE